MLKKKICMVGAFAVGKTSLVQRFVRGVFSDTDLATVGVKIDKKTVRAGEQDLDLILWDIYGDTEFQKVQMSYLRNTSGYLLVVDGTRKSTLAIAFMLQKKVEDTIGRIPFIFVFNKSDRKDEWEIENESIEELSNKGYHVVITSAKTAGGVEEAFLTLAQKILEQQGLSQGLS